MEAAPKKTAAAEAAEAAAAALLLNCAEHSLVHLCNLVICANLERFPPDAFYILPVSAFEEIIELRHATTAPKKKDNDKRLKACITPSFLESVEECTPQFADSEITDYLVWKDAVETKFPRSGISRPVALRWPWPLLIQKVQEAAQTCLDISKLQKSNEKGGSNYSQQLDTAMTLLTETPMNVSLLQETGVGKLMKKVLKNYSQTSTDTSTVVYITQQHAKQFENLMTKWKRVAAQSGVAMKDDASSSSKAASAADTKSLALLQTCQDDCRSWRGLYKTLASRESRRVDQQGAKMRQRRNLLGKERPKIVKVKPKNHHNVAKAQHWSKPALQAYGSQPAGSKLSRLYQESQIAGGRAKASFAAATAPKSNSSFGMAVAFCSGSSGNKKRAKHVQLSNGKRMKLPPPKKTQVKKHQMFKGR